MANEFTIRAKGKTFVGGTFADVSEPRALALEEIPGIIEDFKRGTANAMAAGFEVFRAFDQDAKDFAALAKTKLKMPMLVLTGEKASGEFLIQQGRLVADNVEGVIVKGSGHWLMDEARDQVVPKLMEFFGG